MHSKTGVFAETPSPSPVYAHPVGSYPPGSPQQPVCSDPGSTTCCGDCSPPGSTLRQVLSDAADEKAVLSLATPRKLVAAPRSGARWLEFVRSAAAILRGGTPQRGSRGGREEQSRYANGQRFVAGVRGSVSRESTDQIGTVPLEEWGLAEGIAGIAAAWRGEVLARGRTAGKMSSGERGWASQSAEAGGRSMRTLVGVAPPTHRAQESASGSASQPAT